MLRLVAKAKMARFAYVFVTTFPPRHELRSVAMGGIDRDIVPDRQPGANAVIGVLDRRC
jgi:hypothetical protein